MATHQATKSLLNISLIIFAIICLAIGLLLLRWNIALLFIAAAFFIFGALAFKIYINMKLSGFKLGIAPEHVDPKVISKYSATVFPARYVNLGPVIDGHVYVGTCSSNFSDSRNCFAYSSPDGISWKLLKNFSDGIHTEVPIVYPAQRGLYATLHPNPIELWRSTDKGTSWEKVFSHATERTIYCLLETEKYLFFGTWPEGAIYRSLDGASDWECVFEGAHNGFFSMLALDSGSHGKAEILFAGSWSILKSEDGGKTWHTLETDDIGPIRALLECGNKSIVAIGDRGILISEDGGDSWEHREIDFAGDHLSHFSILHKEYIYTGGNAGIVYRSGNHGKEWERFFEIPQSLNAKKKMFVQGITAWENTLYIGTSHYLFEGDPCAEFYRIDLK